MRWRFSAIAVLAASTLAAGTMGATSALATSASLPHRQSAALPAGPVSAIPANKTPSLVKTTTTMTVRQLAQCGNTMYAVGEFHQISSNGTVFTRNNIFSFSATSPFTMTGWDPNVNGEVNSIAFHPSKCGDAYIGGSFTKVGNTTVANIAEIDTSTGAVVSGFGHNANGVVNTLAMTPTGHLLAGGKFTSVNGGANKYFASLNPATGADDGFLRLHIFGHYHFCNTTECSTPFPTQIYNQQISHGGTLDLAEGVFGSAGGKARKQIFMLNLATNPAQVTGWTSPEWDGSQGNLPNGYPYECWFKEPFYIRGAAWSPDDSTIYIADTGFHPYNLPTNVPRSGLCDALAAFPAAHAPVLHTWINYTGCYSLYTVAADDGAVYAAGHPKYSGNPKGCKFGGPGSTVDPGLEGVSPATGTVELNSSGAAKYTMSRANADHMLITSAGLWIASTNRFGSNFCVKAANHAGICLLPYK